MAENRGGAEGAGSVVLAALILGIAIVAGAALIRNGLEKGADELAGVQMALAELQEGLAEARAQAPAQPARQAQARPNRPDPAKRYEVDTKGSPALGPDDAKVEIVEFSDFQCPFCARVTPTLKQVEETYGDDVRIVFKHLPLSIHPKAPAAHAASEAAHRQGKFWEMHDRIFANQREMSPEKYREWAGEMGLDLDQYDRDVADPEIKKRIDDDTRQAAALLVRGTPGFFINGRFLSGAQPFERFKQVIDEELEEG